MEEQHHDKEPKKAPCTAERITISAFIIFFSLKLSSISLTRFAADALYSSIKQNKYSPLLYTLETQTCPRKNESMSKKSTHVTIAEWAYSNFRVPPLFFLPVGHMGPLFLKGVQPRVLELRGQSQQLTPTRKQNKQTNKQASKQTKVKWEGGLFVQCLDRKCFLNRWALFLLHTF